MWLEKRCLEARATRVWVRRDLEYLVQSPPHVRWCHFGVVQGDCDRSKRNCEAKKHAARNQHPHVHSGRHENDANVEQNAASSIVALRPSFLKQDFYVIRILQNGCFFTISFDQGCSTGLGMDFYARCGKGQRKSGEEAAGCAFHCRCK